MGEKATKLDWPLLISVFLLLTVGLTVLYSISSSGSDTQGMSIFQRQLVFSIVGFFVMIFFAKANYHYLRSYSTPIYFITLAVLIAVLIFGTTVRGTSGWISMGPFNIQPVEISKIALIIFLASFISQKRMEIGEVGRMIASLILTGVMVFLVIKQPDFGSSLILLSIWLGLVFISGISRKIFLSLLIGFLFISFIGWFQLAGYQQARIMNFVQPGLDPKGGGYNVIQSIVAVGSGGITGKGIGHGSQSQLNFLPEKHTDFIFASIAEELGFLGSMAVIILFGIIFYRIKRIAQEAPDNFGYLVAIGVMTMFFVQVLINIGMNIGIMPVTGIPLPFLSYGGSSLVAVFAAVGILININSRKENIVKSYQD